MCMQRQIRISTSFVNLCRLQQYVEHDVKRAVVHVGDVDDDGELFVETGRPLVLQRHSQAMRTVLYTEIAIASQADIRWRMSTNVTSE